MIDKVYEIGNKKLYIYCENSQYCKKIDNWVRVYKCDNNVLNNYDAYIKIYKSKLVWKVNDNEVVIDGEIKHTDLYPIFYNTIANLLLDTCNILIHSVVLEYKNKCVLVLGDFGSGKTTISLEAMKNDISVLSTDQSTLYYENNNLYLVNGSTYMKINDRKNIFVKNIKRNKKIEYIINLIGISDNGKVSFDKIDNKEYFVKTMFKYITWHSDVPLFTSSFIPSIDRFKIKEIISKYDLVLYNVRGDKIKVIEMVKELLR